MSTRQPAELDVLVERWVQTVHEIELGYRLTFDDYLNDLDVRNSIAQQLQAGVTGNSATPGDAQRTRETGSDTGPVVVNSLREILAEADARFRAVTKFAGECVWGEANARAEGWSPEGEWWYYRLPASRGEAW